MCFPLDVSTRFFCSTFWQFSAFYSKGRNFGQLSSCSALEIETNY